MKRRPNVDADRPFSPGGTVTGIVASPRAPGRFTVMVDDRPAHTLNLAALERLGIAVGATTLGREETIAREEAILATYDRAVMMLAARGRAAKDLERQLVRKGEPAEFARVAVERLASGGFVDDKSYARNFVRSKTRNAGLARLRLQRELGRQGVERAIAAEAIAEVFEEDAIDEVATAVALATTRAYSLRGIDPQSQRRRLYSYLARRGYSPSVIAAAMETAANGRGNGPLFCSDQ